MKRRRKVVIYQSLNYGAISDSLEQILEFYYDAIYEKRSFYSDYYIDLIVELGMLAETMYDELSQVITYVLPWDIQFSDSLFIDEEKGRQSHVIWFNTVTCMINSIDMDAWLNQEEIYIFDEAEEKHQEQIRKLKRLTKQQQMLLFRTVTEFILRCLELRAAYNTIATTIAELEFHQPFHPNDPAA